MTPQYLQWTITNLLSQTRRYNPLECRGLSVTFVMEKVELEFEMSSHILLFHRSVHTSRNIMLLLLFQELVFVYM